MPAQTMNFLDEEDDPTFELGGMEEDWEVPFPFSEGPPEYVSEACTLPRPGCRQSVALDFGDQRDDVAVEFELPVTEAPQVL